MINTAFHLKPTLLLLLICFFTQITLAQINSGTVIYKVNADRAQMKEILKKDQLSDKLKGYLSAMFKNQIKTLPYLFYTLKFNHKESLFTEKKTMASDNGFDIHQTARNVGVTGVYYTSIEDNKTYHQVKVMGNLYSITHQLSSFNWTISSETKTILGYTCYKATTNFEPHFGKGGKIIAWFTNDIPFQTGPAFYGGLPGLILQLKQGYYTFSATELNFSKRRKNITKPTIKNTVTFKEFGQQYEEMKNRYR